MTKKSDNPLISNWGLLGIGGFQSTRRARTLQLGGCVRDFNDLAVPGMGGVSFGKQLYLSAMGVAVAEQARKKGFQVSPIEVANAIEALGCRLSYEKSGWKQSNRLLGITKLRNVTDLSFDNLRKRSTYVTQPMRMPTVQALPAIGLAESDWQRFNRFQLSQIGESLIEQYCNEFGLVYHSQNVKEYLTTWVIKKGSQISQSENLYKAISPLIKLSSKSKNEIRNLILNNGDEKHTIRRKAIFNWAETLAKQENLKSNWQSKPVALSNDHWLDLKSGAYFFATRNAALKLLDQIEIVIARSKEKKISLSEANKEFTKGSLNIIKRDLLASATRFLQLDCDSSENKEATRFCNECLANNDTIRRLIERDGVGLQLSGENIIRGYAFKGEPHRTANDLDNDVYDSDNENVLDEAGGIDKNEVDLFPENISFRVYRMNLLYNDLK